MAKAKKQPTAIVPPPSARLRYVTVYFGDEVPAFGCGFQSVLALGEPDERQVQLMRISDCDTAVLPYGEFEEMVRNRNSKVIDLDEERVPVLKARLLRNAATYDRNSAMLRDMLLELGMAESDLPTALRHTIRTSSIIDPTAVGDGGPEAPMAGEGSGKLMQRLWMTGRYTPEDLVAIVLANWPGRKTKVSDVFYNYRLLVKAGVEGVPPWPSKKGN